MTHDTQDGNTPHMTLPNGDIIREGDYAVTREGKKVGPIVPNTYLISKYTHPWAIPVGETYRENGRWMHGDKQSPRDLIAKWHDVAPVPDPVVPDYNDGEWHEWHGGACPVHSLSVIFGVERPGAVPWVAEAQQNDWRSFRGRFRVVTPYVEPVPVTQTAKRDLRTIDEPFGELDERTQNRLRKASKLGWPVQGRAKFGKYHLCAKPYWVKEQYYRLDPTFTPPAKRRKWWIVGGKAFDSAREAKTVFPGSTPIKVKECRQ